MRLRWKLTAGFGTLVVLTTASIGALLAQGFEQEALRSVRQSLASEAHLFRAGVSVPLDHQHAAELQARVMEAGASLRSRLTLIALDGTVLGDSREDPSRMDNHAARPEFVEALQPDRALLMPDGNVDHWHDEFLELVTLA